MQDERIASAIAKLEALQGIRANDRNALEQKQMESQIRAGDLDVKISQLREQQARLEGDARQRLDGPIAELQHERMVAITNLQMTEARLNALRAGMTVQPPHDPLFNRSMLEMTFTGIFFLMLPLVFALSRRIWIRGGPRPQATVDLEASPRLQRIEEAVESIAIEVERIGEAQRFATRLLTERQEPMANRASPIPAPIVRKTPGTITPH